MPRWLDEEEAAMYARILDISFTLSGEFLSQVRRVLILDILDNRIPAAFFISPVLASSYLPFHSPPVVVDLITVARRVDDVQPQAHAIFLDDCKINVSLQPYYLP